MKLHLPVLLRKAVLACFSVACVYSMSSIGVSGADLTLGKEDSLTIDYSDGGSIRDLENGTLQLSGNTILLLSNCGEQDGKTYTLLTGVGSLLDGEGNAITLDSTNNAISNYFDINQPGTGFWADANIVLTVDGDLQLVRYSEPVKDVLTITSRKTEGVSYQYYAAVIASGFSSNHSGTVIYGGTSGTIILSNNGRVEFSKNVRKSASTSSKGAIYGYSAITLSNNGSVEFNENGSYIGGAIYGSSSGTITLSNNGSVMFSQNAAIDYGGAIYGDSTITLSNNGSVEFYGNKTTATTGHGGAISGATITLSNNNLVSFSNNQTNYGAVGYGYTSAGGAIYGQTITLSNNGNIIFNNNTAYYGGAISGSRIVLNDNGSIAFTETSTGGAIRGNVVILRNNGNVVFASSTSTASSNEYAISSTGEITLGNNDSVSFIGFSSAIHVTGNISVADNANISFTQNTATQGGAIYTEGSKFEFSKNRNVSFSDNIAWQGGAIYRTGNIDFSGNTGIISFSSNVSKPGYTGSGTSMSAFGGAVYASGVLAFADNKEIVFESNKSDSSTSIYSLDSAGGATYSAEANFINNSKVIFSNNSITRTNSSYENDAYGGAVYVTNKLLFDDNDEVRITGNYAEGDARGGAIYAGTEVQFINNGVIIFENNRAVAGTGDSYHYGGAIYTPKVDLVNNKKLIFKGNYERNSAGSYRLRSLYIDDPSSITQYGSALISTAYSDGIEFFDSFYINGGLRLNEKYTTPDNVEIPQIGDIVISALYADDSLYYAKGNIDGSATELMNSKTSEVTGVTHLYDGRLRVEDGAIFSSKGGIEIHSSVTGKSTPTLYLRNSSLNGSSLLLEQGTLLELAGKNTATFTTLQLNDSGSVTFHMNGENADFAVLRFTGAFAQNGALTLNISFNDTEAEAGLYKLMTVTSITDESLWTSSNVTVNGLDGYVVTFDDLEWKDNTLYLNYDGTPGTGGSGSTTPPSLLIATWTNEAQDGMWNSTSLNWEQDEVDYAYVDGVQVVFGDEGAGTVTLVGDIAPSSVLVDSAEDYTWNADETEGGKLTGDMTLTKKGEGKLTINSENDYTGGTSILGGTVVAGSATALGDGVVNLTNATLEIAAEGVSNALTTAGTSSILVQDGGSLTLNAAISNAAAGVLTLSGKVDVSGIGELTKLDATLIDVNGNAGESGFARAEGYTLQVVNGGKVLGSGAELVHSGLPTGLTLVLGENGLAMAGAATDFTKYVVAGSHAVSVSEILKDVPTDSTLSCIEMSGGTLLVDAATDALSATSGIVTVTRDVELGGTMSGGMLLAQAGEIAATLSGSTGVVASGTVTLSGNNSHTGGVMLSGGNLTLAHANALGAGQLVTSGISSLVIDSGVELALSQAISNSGTLSISGNIQAKGNLNTVAATRVDVNGNSGASGFAKDALEWVQIVNGGTTVNAGAAVSHESATGSLVLGSDGRATCGGEIHYNEYLLTGTGVAGVQAIKDAAGSELSDIRMEGGTLTVGTDTAGLLTATDGIIILEAGGKLGADSSLSGVDIKATGGSIASTLTGSNTLEGIGNFALDAVIANNGTLVLSGTIKADALSLVEEQASTFVDVNGNSGASGFAQSAQMSVQLTHGTGNTIDGGVTISHKDAAGTLVLGTNGKASYGGDVDYTHYLLNGIDDKASVSGIIADAGDALNAITVQKGTLTVDAVTKPVTATGGEVVLDGGVLNGSLSDTTLTLKNGSLGAVSISGGSVEGVDYLLSSMLQVSGEVSISGSFNASSLQLITDGVSRVDVVTGNSGNSGFLKYGDSYVQLINGGELTINGATVKHGTIDLTLGTDGYARAEGKTDWSTYLLTGTDKVNVGAVLDASADAAISMNGGELTVDRSFTDLTATGGKILLNTDVALGGNISGSTIHASAGTLAAALSGNNTLVGADFALSGVLNNSGTLTLSGSFTVSALTVDEAATYIGLDGLSGTSGFAKSAYQSVKIARGTTADAGATIKYGDTELTLNTDGTASAGGEVDMGMFYLNDGSASTSAIHTQSALADVTLSNGTLTVDDTATVTSTGGAINLNGGTLNGSVTNTALTLTSGTVNASISGGSLIGSDYALSEVLQVSGEVSISGSFNASSLQLITDGVSRVDVVTGNSGNSGFLKYGDSYVQLINGGELTINGATVKHGTIDLTLGTDGYARTEGKTDWSTYLLTGTDKVNVGAVLDASADAAISMNGGELTVDRSFSELTATGGKILLNTDVALGGNISGSTIHASAGTLAAALSGNNTLVGDDFALSGVLNNSGTLTLSGSFTVSALTVDEAATYIGLDGLSGTSGFAKSVYQSVEIARGTTADAGATIKYGDTELTLNTDGTASAGGEVDMGMFYLNDGSASTSAIHTQSALADVTLSNGTLTVDDTATVSSTGGAINLNGGTLNGSVSNTALTLTSGTVNASISGGSLIGSDYALSEVLQVSGEVSISGSFIADELSLVTTEKSRIDVVTGNSGNSGFLKYGDSYVQLINGGELTINGATVKHGTIDLTLGTDGYARTEGKTDWSTYLLTGTDKVNVGAVLDASADAAISMNGGELTVNRSFSELTATGGKILLNTDVALGGNISGSTIHASAGTLAAALSGNNTLVGDDFALSGVLNNSGTLTLSGSFTVSALTVDEAATYIGLDGLSGTSGFAKSAYQSVKIARGTTADAGATIKYGDTELTLNTDGTASAGGEVDMGMFYLNDGSASTSAIHTQSALADVTLSNGTLTVDDTATVSSTGGAINLNGGTLNGSVTNTALTLTSGTVNASISGGSLIGSNYALSEVLQVSGEVSISGSFNASSLQLITDGVSRVDVVTGNSGNSGFLKYGDSYVQLINGGELTINGATVKHGTIDLTLGADGYARSTGGTNYNEYLLTGSDRVSTQLIHFGAGAGAKVHQEGGQLTVNDETTVKTTNGEIVLSGANLLGEVFDARVTAESGCIAATLGGITAVTITGEVSMSGNNFHSGITTLADGSLTISHANALGSGDLVTTGESKLTVDGVTLALSDAITNTGKLTLSGSIDASALQLNRTEAGRLSLSGERVGLTESGFSQGVEYTVLIVDGGSTVNAGAGISHKDYLSRTQLVLGEDGVARAGAEVDYTHFFLTGGDSAEVSKIAEVSTRNQVELNGVTMDSGLLTVDQSITVSATGGSLVVTDAATLGGAIDNATVSTAAGDYTAEIAATLKGTTSLEIAGGTITVSGDNSYTGGTEVNGGTLMSGHNNALGSGDVTVNGAALDLNDCTIANKVFMNGTSTLSHANGASYIMLGSGSNVSFRDGYALNSRRTLAVAAGGATYKGALTLSGGTLALSGQLTVSGDVVFEAGTKTTLDVSGWASANDGTILADFGAANRGYADDSLTLSGLAGDWELDFDTATGILTLVAVQEEVKPGPTPKPEFAPKLNRNQQIVFDTVKDIVAEGKPEGERGKLVEQITATRNEEELRSLLDAVSGSEYATLMSSQIDSNLGHMRNLRSKMGQGWQLVGNNYMRAMIEMFGQQSELDADGNGQGYKRNETGGQFTLEFIGCTHMSSGVAVAASRTKLTPDNALEQTIDNAYVDFYTSYRSNGDQNTGYSAKFSLGVGMHDYNLKRNVLGMQAEATTEGFSVNFMHESAYAMSLTEESSLQVFGVLENSFGSIDGFRENGLGTASLMMDKQNAWTTDMTLGLRYIQMFESLATPKATLTLQGGITATAGDTTVDTKLHFAGAQQHAYTQHGAKRGRLGYNLGFNLHMPMDDTSAVYCHGETILRSGSTEWNANIGYQVAF